MMPKFLTSWSVRGLLGVTDEIGCSNFSNALDFRFWLNLNFAKLTRKSLGMILGPSALFF